VCVKWVDLRPEIDPVTGAVTNDVRRYGFSEADQAALEVGLRLATARATTVRLVCAAPPAAEGALRELAASGAAKVVRVDTAEHDPSDVIAASIAASIAAAISDGDLRRVDDDHLVVCGDYSIDRGSGSVPSLLAHHLGTAQATGLVDVVTDAAGPIAAVRRLDGGRREHVRVQGPAVISVEGSVATLRRAPMRAVLAARALPITIAPTVPSGTPTVTVERSEPIRPRARVFAAPTGERALSRIVELTGALVERTPPRRVEADPVTAAVVILDQVKAWGYVDTGDAAE